MTDSAETLDSMLAAGQLSAEEYRKLRAAMEGPEAADPARPQPAAAQTSPAARKLMRSRRSRVIAGVCGGLAERYNAPAWVFRLIAVVLLLFYVIPALVAYIVFWAIVPEDPHPLTSSDPMLLPTRGSVIVFGIVTGVLGILPIFFCGTMMPKLVAIYVDLKAELPSATRLVLSGIGFVSHWGFFILPLFLIGWIGLIRLYARMPSARGRWMITASLVLISLLSSGLVLVALYLPLFSMPQLIR